MDDVSIIVANRQLSGWTEVRITRGVEQCPSSFDIAFTELFPGDATAFVVQAGDACQVKIGNDLVITGYVDRCIGGIGPSSHPLRITGRSKCADLVDCSAEWPNSQISGASALSIATKIAKPYGITVSGLDGKTPPQFNFMLGETAFEIIERVTRNAGLLAYDEPDGNLVLAHVGSERAASGFTEGQNIEEATFTSSMDQRFSEYDVFLQSMDVLGDVGGGGNLVARIKDPNVKRNRKRFIIAEAGGGGLDISKARGNWDCARRAGRSTAVTLTADSWRDQAGALWRPNTLAPLSIPTLKLRDVVWAIGEVTYKRDGSNGNSVEATLMPPNAFLPEPILLQPTFPDVLPPGVSVTSR